MNLKNLVSVIKTASEAYPTVQEFGEGDIYLYLNNGEHKYPCIFLTIESISTNGDTQDVNATLFFVDRLMSDSSNRIDVQTVGLSALKTIIEKIQESNYFTFSNINYTPFDEKFTDLCAGAFAKCVIEVNDVLECSDEFEGYSLTIKENGLYDVLGYSQVLVDITRVRSIDGHTGDITLGDGLTIDENNVLSGTPTQTLEAGTNITITQEGNNYRFDVPDMTYDDSQIKEDIAALEEVEIPTIVATTTNFTSGSKWTITTAFERCANLFEGILNDITNNIKALFPTEASSTNQLADKAFVNSTVASGAANFRGNWATWYNVPTDSNGYPSDYSGNKKPTNNDYMVVNDASDYYDTSVVRGKISIYNKLSKGWYTVAVVDENGGETYHKASDGFQGTWKAIDNNYSLYHSGGAPGWWYIKPTSSSETKIVVNEIEYYVGSSGIRLFNDRTDESTVYDIGLPPIKGQEPTEYDSIKFRTVNNNVFASYEQNQLIDMITIAQATSAPVEVGTDDVFTVQHIGNGWVVKNLCFCKDEDTGKTYKAGTMSLEIADNDTSFHPILYNTTFVPTESGYTGTWRFHYIGDWDVKNVSGWKPEYQIEPVFTADERAALDSKITNELVVKYNGYDTRITANETNKVDKNNTAYKVYGTASDGTQCVYTAGTNVNFNEITDEAGNKTHNISANGAYEKVLQTTETATVNANTYNYWENPVNSLNITLVDGADTNVVNEFVMRFKVGTGFTGITFNKSIRYKGLTPAWTENTTYELSIVDGYCLYSIYFA